MRGRVAVTEVRADKRGSKGRVKGATSTLGSPSPSQGKLKGSICTIGSPAPAQGKHQTVTTATTTDLGGGVDDAIPSCCGCGILVSDDVSALQCDVCKSGDMWKCTDCLGLTKAAYSALLKCKELEWRCAGCRSESLMRKTDALDKTTEILRAIGQVMERLGDLEKTLSEKVDTSVWTVVESKLQHLEDRVRKSDYNELMTTTDRDDQRGAIRQRDVKNHETV